MARFKATRVQEVSQQCSRELMAICRDHTVHMGFRLPKSRRRSARRDCHSVASPKKSAASLPDMNAHAEQQARSEVPEMGDVVGVSYS
jgi:hypothetical protein